MESGKTMILAWVNQKKFKLSNIENNTMKFVLDGHKVFKKLTLLNVFKYWAVVLYYDL